jgi:uncharacterized membrane protein
VRWDIVLAPEVIDALDRQPGDSARTLLLAGNDDDWAVTGFEVRNYYVEIGARPAFAVVPAGADAHTPAGAFGAVATGVFVLAIVSGLWTFSQRRSMGLAGNGLAFVAFLVCVMCLLLARVSPYKVLLSPGAFLAIVTGLFAPILFHAAVRAPSTVRALVTSNVATRTFSRAARYWNRHQVTLERGAALLGLSAIAIAQPVFDVISNSPEFFAARGTPATTAIGGVLAICFGIPLAVIAIERALRLVNRHAATTFYMFAVALLVAAVAMPWLRRNAGLSAPWDLVVCGSVAVALAVSSTTRIGSQFFTALVPAAFLVPALFLLNGDVRQSLLPSESAAGVQSVERTPPIVFVIFDELPLVSLVGTDGQIEAARFPNFAGLARDAYWFRNASTVASNTSHAVPAILSGRYPTAVNDVPTLRYYPVNLFTTLARHYEIVASLRFQQICPPRACEDRSGLTADSVEALLSDLSIVWLHIVLPERFTDGLPPVTDDWAEFGRTPEARTGGIQGGRSGVFAQFVRAIDGSPKRLYFIHEMLPHMPLEYVPSGRRYVRPDNENQLFRHDRLFEGASATYADTVHQRHLAQAGFVDHLLGDLMTRLREVGLYDKALIVVTADHGASYREGRLRRQPQEGRNLADILRVPLFVKVPGQAHGEVVDRIVETVDILPTVFDVIGARSPLRFDGRSMLSAPARTERTFVWRNRSNVDVRTFGDLTAEIAVSLERKERRFGRDDAAGLYASPAVRRLLGVAANAPSMARARHVRITVRNPRQFRSVNLTRDPLPLYVSGALDASGSDSLTVAVAVNGVVAAVTRSYGDRGGQMFGTLIPETSLRAGDNEVAAFVVDTAARQ